MSLCDAMFWVGCVVVLSLVSGWWFNGYFRRRGVKHLPPSRIPFIGHMWDTLIQKESFMDFTINHYSAFPGEKYVGMMQFVSPVAMINDVDLLKQICIKDFDHFLDHQGTLSESEDLLFGKGLFGLRGQKWRDMRATLSPAFTSSKIRGMFEHTLECGEQMVQFYMNQMNIEENKSRGLLELEMRDVFTRYATDVIATTAFGLHVDSFANPNNTFYLMGKKATDFSGFNMLKFNFLMLFPKTAKFLGINFLTKNVADFFRNLVWDTIRDREQRNIARNDMIQLLMEAKKGTLKHELQEDDKDAGFATVQESAIGKATVRREWEDDDIVAQAVLFFSAGFDSTSNLICFATHELAVNPEIQRRLQKEVDEVADSLDGKLTCDVLQKMKYMDMVVCETLRKWPLNVITDRMCVKPYTLPPPNEQSTQGLDIKVGEMVAIPIYGFHHDPKYFENPNVFDPERFSDERKHNIVPGSYIPFGIGPRNCIGSRLALMEVKAVLYNIVLKFELVPTAKTQHPIKIRKDTFSMLAEKGFWVGLKPRQQY